MMLGNLICRKMVGRFMNRLCIIWFLWRLFFCVIKWFLLICLTGKSASIKQLFVLVTGFYFIINLIPVFSFSYKWIDLFTLWLRCLVISQKSDSIDVIWYEINDLDEFPNFHLLLIGRVFEVGVGKRIMLKLAEGAHVICAEMMALCCRKMSV